MTPNDPMTKVYASIDAVIDEVGTDDPGILTELTQTWGRNPKVMRHIMFRLGPTRAQFDAHLGGASIEGHTAKAETVAKLLTGITSASKEIAKHNRGVRSLQNDYLVHGVLPGSVRLLIEAPETSRKSKDDVVEGTPPARRAFHTSSPESEALRRVATVLTTTNPQLGDGGVGDLVRALPAASWQPLKSVATAVRDSGIELSGEVREREKDPVDLAFDPDKALTLTTAIDRSPIPETIIVERGIIDGFRKTQRRIYFAPKGKGSITLHVRDEALLAAASMMVVGAEEAWAEVTYVRRVFDDVSSRNRNDARVLTAIRPVAPPTQSEQLAIDAGDS